MVDEREVPEDEVVDDDEVVKLVVEEGEAVVESLEEIGEEEEEEEEEVLVAGDEAGKEALVERAIPQQANEFICQNCFLVRHRSQLADPKKQYCVDCV